MTTRIEKICTGCGETKPAEAFHKALLGRFGLAARCKACVSAASAERYHAKRAVILARAKKYRDDNADVVREKNRARYKRDRKKRSAYQRAHRRAHPNKSRARMAVAKALRRGTLTKPSSCQQCGRGNVRLIAHHRSYEPAHWLDVTFICDACHGAHHGQERSPCRASQ